MMPDDFSLCSKARTSSDVAEGQEGLSRRGPGRASLYGATKIAEGFNVANDVYKKGRTSTAISIL